MLPMKYHTINRYLTPYVRIGLLSSSSEFGTGQDDVITSHIGNFVKNMESETPYQIHDTTRIKYMPDINRHSTENNNIKSDLLIGDTSRHYMGMEERYRRGMLDLHGYRSIYDGETRYYNSCCRGIERHLLKKINDIEGEALNYKTIVPRGT